MRYSSQRKEPHTPALERRAADSRRRWWPPHFRRSPALIFASGNSSPQAYPFRKGPQPRLTDVEDRYRSRQRQNSKTEIRRPKPKLPVAGKNKNIGVKFWGQKKR